MFQSKKHRSADGAFFIYCSQCRNKFEQRTATLLLHIGILYKYLKHFYPQVEDFQSCKSDKLVVGVGRILFLYVAFHSLNDKSCQHEVVKKLLFTSNQTRYQDGPKFFYFPSFLELDIVFVFLLPFFASLFLVVSMTSLILHHWPHTALEFN